MRSTEVNIDQAGNLWFINNWKPDFDIDSVGQNPGGDGIIIFVASPHRLRAKSIEIAGEHYAED